MHITCGTLFVLGVLLLWKDVMTIATLKRNMFNLDWLIVQVFSPLLWKVWQHAHRHGIGEIAKSSTSGSTGSSRKRVRHTGPILNIWNFKAAPQWHTLPPRPHLMPHPMGLWGGIFFQTIAYPMNWKWQEQLLTQVFCVNPAQLQPTQEVIGAVNDRMLTAVLVDRPMGDGLKDIWKGGRGTRVWDKINLTHVLTSRTPIQP